jgi:abhydrolase domain-containing protein 5
MKLAACQAALGRICAASSALPVFTAAALLAGAGAIALHRSSTLRAAASGATVRATAALASAGAAARALPASAAAAAALASAGAAAHALPASAAAAAGWRPTPPQEAADACLAHLRTSVRTPFTTYTLAGLYTVELVPPYPGAPKLVLMPGYSSGAGMWAPSLDHLARHYHVLAVDWLGTGASERPPFPPSASVDTCEAFFIEALEAWRVQRLGGSATERITLVGHSLGGYLASAFALSFPQAVEHLVLVNAAGLPQRADPRIQAAREHHWLVGALGWAWESGVTPGAVARGLGPWGAGLVEGIVVRRFARHPEPPSPQLAKYVSCITTAPGSGEFALAGLLHFGAHAKAPMAPRLLRAWRGKTTLIHGQHDWTSLDASEDLARDLRALGVDAEFHAVPHSEHYVFMEKPLEFARIVEDRRVR